MVNTLIGKPQVVHDNQFSVGLAVEHQIAERVKNHRIRILQIQCDGRISRDVGRGRARVYRLRHADHVSAETGLNHGRG
jgi:hypothetical protein